MCTIALAIRRKNEKNADQQQNDVTVTTGGREEGCQRFPGASLKLAAMFTSVVNRRDWFDVCMYVCIYYISGDSNVGSGLKEKYDQCCCGESTLRV